MSIEEQDDDNNEESTSGASGDFSTVGSKIKDGEYIKAWGKLKDENPKTYLAAAITPGTGQLAAVADYAEAMKAGKQGDAAMAAASFIPMVKMANVGKAAHAHYVGKAAAVADTGRDVKAAHDEKKQDRRNSYTGSWAEE